MCKSLCVNNENSNFIKNSGGIAKEASPFELKKHLPPEAAEVPFVASHEKTPGKTPEPAAEAPAPPPPAPEGDAAPAPAPEGEAPPAEAPPAEAPPADAPAPAE